MRSDDAFVGIDLGGTDIKAVVLGRDGSVLHSAQAATDAALGRDAVLDRLTTVMTDAVQSSPRPVVAGGFAIPGVLDPETGTVELLTNFTPEWAGFGLREAIQARTELPVYLLNDVRAATVAERDWGAGREYRNFVCIAIGTGIGGGLILNGELYTGSRGAAGEIGHQTIEAGGPRCNCGNSGCLEALAGGYAIAREARAAIEGGDLELAALAGSRTPSPGQVAQAAQAGNAVARRIWTAAGTYIGRALANVVCVLNPEAIVVGGGIAGAGNLLLDPIRDELRRRTVVFSERRGGVAVVPSPLGSRAGAVGAATWAMRQCAGRTS